MNNLHLIDNAIFDTSYAEPGLADEQRSQVDEFIKNNLMSVVEEIFDQFDSTSVDPGSIMRLDNLEIDLGEIAFSDYRQRMPEKLSQHLLQALDDMRFTPVDQAPDTNLPDGRHNAQSPLFYFLRKGYLPWYARSDDAADPATLDSMLLQSIEQNPDILLEFMLADAERDAVLQRLVNQFSAQCLQQVMRLLSAAQGSAARQTLVQLETMLGVDDNAEDSDSEPSLSVSPKRTAQPEWTQPAERIEQIDRLRRQLVAALLSEHNGRIESLWSVLFADHGRLLEQTLRYYGQQQLVRRRIVTVFTATMRAELLRLLEPDAHDWLQSLLDHVEIFESRAGDAEVFYKPRNSELWEFSLGYLLVERGVRFDAKAFLLSLLRQIAISSEQSEALLLVSLRQNIDTISKSGRGNEWSQRLARLVETIDSFEPGEAFQATDRNGHAEATDQSEPVETPREVTDSYVMGSRQAHSYRRYERVKSALTIADRAHRSIESEFIDDIKNLQRESPWLLQRLFRELQTGSYDLSRATAEWSPGMLAELCYALLSLNSQSGSLRPYGAATELVLAIQHKATESPDRQALFNDILGRLIKGELIDLEATPAQQRAGEQLSGQPVNDADTSDQFAPADSTRLTSVRELVYMGRRARAQILQCAELLTTAAYVAETGLSEERLNAIKWQFIQTYVIATGYFFNESFFTRRYVDHLIQQARLSDSRKFQGSLGQGLLQNLLPATRDLTRRLIEVLRSDVNDTPRFIEPRASEPGDTDDDPLPREDIYIANAGMVLLAPYLPRLFERLGFTDHGEFKTRLVAERAVHCLQYLVNSNLNSPEYQLVLNKLLCGVKPGLPICRSIELSADERLQLEGLLKAVKQHWKALENTSIDGLRESFLRRNGRLQLKDDSWQLAVETRAFDMLLEQLPWSFNTIKFAWMDRVIYVEWQ